MIQRGCKFFREISVAFAVGLGGGGSAAWANDQTGHKGTFGYDPDRDAGFLTIFGGPSCGDESKLAARIWVTENGQAGRITIFDAQETRDAQGHCISSYEDADRKVVLDADEFHQGRLWIRGGSLPGGEEPERARLSVGDDSNTGFLQLRGGIAGSRVIFAGAHSAELSGEITEPDCEGPALGAIRVYGCGVDGVGGQPVAGLSARPDESGSYGRLQVNNAAATNYVVLVGSEGNILKTGVNAFVLNDPADPHKQIVYAAIEGPEAAAYIRGTATLVSGVATVQLPEHFAKVVSPGGLTAQATPLSRSSPGLAVVSLSPTALVVQELARGGGPGPGGPPPSPGGPPAGAGGPPPGTPGAGSYAFAYFVQGVRKGFEGFAPVRDRSPPEPDFAEADGVVGEDADTADAEEPPAPRFEEALAELIQGLERRIRDEIVARIDADMSLLAMITTEISERAAAVQAVFDALAQEAAVRAAEDAALWAAIDSEKNARIGADETLTTKMAADDAATLDAAKGYTDGVVATKAVLWSADLDTARTETLAAAQTYCDDAMSDSSLRSCPAGCLAVGGFCIGGASGSGTWNEAAATCLLAGFRLCRESELLVAAQAGAYDAAALDAWMDATCGDGVYKYDDAASASDDLDGCAPRSETHDIVCCADR